jgi:hypothetical protein
MAITGTISLVDHYQRTTQRSFEMVDAVLADAETDLATLETLLNPLTDAGFGNQALTEKNIQTPSPVAGSNIDEGLSVKVRLSGGGTGTIKIPAPPAAKLQGDGTVPTDDADLVAFFEALGLNGATHIATVYNGQTVTALISAKLDR